MRRILVDMDGVIADFEAQFLNFWRRAYPDARWVDVADRREHYVDRDPSGAYDVKRSHLVIETAGFYASMPEVPGAIAALNELSQHADVCICTAPFGDGEVMARCEAEKRAWIAEKLGDSWLSPERFICVKDKTVVSGLLLIDDKPAPDSHWRGVAQKP